MTGHDAGFHVPQADHGPAAHAHCDFGASHGGGHEMHTMHVQDLQVHH
jgi:hypothetical protein